MCPYREERVTEWNGTQDAEILRSEGVVLCPLGKLVRELTATIWGPSGG